VKFKDVYKFDVVTLEEDEDEDLLEINKTLEELKKKYSERDAEWIAIQDEIMNEGGNVMFPVLTNDVDYYTNGGNNNITMHILAHNTSL
jgi:hypothetical protein